MKAKDLKDLKPAEVIAKIGALFTADQKKTGVLACVSMGQFILESGWGKSELCQNANNGFGMKESLSGNTWPGSVWDGSVYKKRTAEYKNGTDKYYITAKFRKYPSLEKSIEDHSAYLVGAMDGKKKRYAGLKDEKNYKTAVNIIASGGYATSSEYARSVIQIIEEYNLTKFNVVEKKKKGVKAVKKKGVKKNMVVNIHAGHTKQTGKAPGASGYFHESVEDRKVKNAAKADLKKKVKKVYDCTSNGKDRDDNLNRIIKKCNKHKADLDVSIHFNCSNGEGHGVECWIYSNNSKAKKAASRICTALTAVGFTNRGVKVNPEFRVLRKTNAPAIIVEICFCDNKKDAALYKKLTAEKIGKIISKAIVG